LTYCRHFDIINFCLTFIFLICGNYFEIITLCSSWHFKIIIIIMFLDNISIRLTLIVVVINIKFESYLINKHTLINHWFLIKTMVPLWYKQISGFKKGRVVSLLGIFVCVFFFNVALSDNVFNPLLFTVAFGHFGCKTILYSVMFFLCAVMRTYDWLVLECRLALNISSYHL
jgi:hypothetical protein